jgi:hypothetical protein
MEEQIMNEFFTLICQLSDSSGAVFGRLWFSPEIKLFSCRRFFRDEIIVAAYEGLDYLRGGPIHCTAQLNRSQSLDVELRCSIGPDGMLEIYARKALLSSEAKLVEDSPVISDPKWPLSDRFGGLGPMNFYWGDANRG